MEKMRPPQRPGPEQPEKTAQEEQLDEGALIQKMMEESGFHMSKPVEQVPSGPIVYDGFEQLPNYKRQIDRAVSTCRLFLEKGVIINDDFENEHVDRRAAQVELREKIRGAFGDDAAAKLWELRNYNLLRAGGLQQMMMARVLDPLGNGLMDIDTPQAKRVCEIMARFPKIRRNGSGEYQLSDPKFQWMLDLIRHMEEEHHIEPEEAITESTAYREMTHEQKLGIVAIFQSIAKDFLDLVTEKEVDGVGGGITHE